MSRFTLTTGVDRVVLTGGVNRITAATDTLSAGDVVVAPAASDTALVLENGNRFDLAAPTVLSGVSTIRDHSAGNSVITLRDGLNLTLHLGVDNATVYGADNADRIIGGSAGGSATVVLGSARESVRAGPGGATVLMNAQTAGADIGGKGRTTIELTGRYGDAVTLGHEVHAVAELDVLSAGLRVDLSQAGVATVALSASGTTLTAGAAVRLVSDYAGGSSIVFAGADQTLLLPYASLDLMLAPDRLAGFAAGDTIDVAMPFSASEQLSYDGATGRLTLANCVSQVSETVMLAPHLEGTLRFEADAGLPGGYQGTAIRLWESTPGAAAPCFAAGTRVLADRGWVRVEDMAVGDRLVTARGDRRRLRWIGYRNVECGRHPSPAEVWPVRIVAGAFAAGLPAADVVLSPDHAVLLDRALVPLRYLVNGATICVEPVARVRYYHLELASHDVVLAEGLPVETYLDTGNRHQFSNGTGHVALHPRFGRTGWSDAACAPLVTGGAIVQAARAGLLARADALGYATTADADLHLVGDGQRVWGTVANGIWTGWAPPGVRALRLASRIAAPADCAADSDDHRRLGVAISRIVVRGGNVVRTLAASDPEWGRGFYPEEHDDWSSWRWTDGAGELPPTLWREIDDGFRVDLHVFRMLTYRCEPAGRRAAAG